MRVAVREVLPGVVDPGKTKTMTSTGNAVSKFNEYGG